MTQSHYTLLKAGAALAALCALPAQAAAQDISLNYDNLSSLEEPFAFEVGDITVEVTGIADGGVIGEKDNISDTESVDPVVAGNFQISAETQLANRWTVGAAYFGQYSNEAVDVFGGDDGYSDNVAGFIGTSFGTVLGGNVNGQVREVTRRARAVGNGLLAFDDFYGGLDQWGGAYVGRFGPSVLVGAVDENGNFEVGAVFQRPIGQQDYRFAFRAADGRFTSQDGTVQFNTRGVSAVAELVYGSTLFDLGGGYEKLTSAVTDADRWFLSAGTRAQMGSFRFSAEGHYGQAAGDDEMAVGIGAAYDIARGLSVNLGVNFEEAIVISDGVTLVETDEAKAVASMRFSF
jgi:hypothetical protein